MRNIPYTLLVLATLVITGCTSENEVKDSNASACDCETVVLSGEEVAAGCTSLIKERNCPLFRAVMTRDRQPQNRNQRELERRMETKF